MNPHFTKQQGFLNQFKDVQASDKTQNKQAKKALEFLQEYGFPTTKVENWHYTNIDEITKQTLKLAKNELEQINFHSFAETHHEFVFINGFFQKNLSSYQEDSFSFSTSPTLSKEETNEFFNLDKIVAHEPFVNLNLAYGQQINLLRINSNSIIKRPIHIVNIHTANQSLSLPRLLIKQQKNSEATICETYTSQTHGLIAALNNISLDENAKLKYYRYSSNQDNYYFNKTYISLKRDANIQACSYNLGGKISRIDLDIRFNGEGAYATADGLYTVKGNEKCDNRTEFHHHQPHTTSRQLYKGVLNGNSHGIFNTKVFIDKNAQKVDSEQLSNNLLLSEMARVDAKPELDVKADDVKAGHGATVGQLSPEELFYLQSRGIDKQTAFKMLIHSFVDQIILKIDQAEFQKFIHNHCYEDFLQQMELE